MLSPIRASKTVLEYPYQFAAGHPLPCREMISTVHLLASDTKRLQTFVDRHLRPSPDSTHENGHLR